jgi:hypothetical protein
MREKSDGPGTADGRGGLTSPKAALDLAMPAAAIFSPSREITSRSASAPLS